MNIYFIRHGKTIFNAMGKSQGWSDAPLTPEGVQGAVDVGRGLAHAGVTFDRAYSSDLTRQRRTARIILDQMGLDQLPVIENEGFREVGFGCHEAGVDSDMYIYPTQKYGCKDIGELFETAGLKNVVDAIAESDTMFHMAEDYETACSRMKAALDQVVSDLLACGGENAMVVTSGMSLNCLIQWLGFSMNGPIENCSVTTVVWENDSYTITAQGDESYRELGKSLRELA